MAEKKSRRSPADHLPKKAPKKTGKGMKPPEDPENKETGEESPELLEVAPPPPAPVVVEDRFSVSYRKPIFSLAPKTGTKLLALQMAVMLGDEHKKRGLLPGIVRTGWDFVAQPRRKAVTLIDVPGQSVSLYLAAESKGEPLLFLPAAKIINATLAVIQKKGEGESLKVIRFLFRVQVEFNREVAKFAESNYGNTFWMTLKRAQGEMFDEGEEE